MSQTEVLIVGLLVAVAVLSVVSRWLPVPYPIVLVVGGALLGFVPGLPKARLSPEVVLIIFLPPLIYSAAGFANAEQFRANLRTLTLTTVGLVLAAMCAVAWAARALIPGLPWAAAFVLGAIVSPTDPIAVSIIMRRLDAPRRLISIIEGEGLFNNATAFVAYQIAVAAVVTGRFSLAGASLKFVLGAAGGVAIGLAVGVIIVASRKRIRDTQINVTISLLTGYAAFVPADAVGASGVLATATTGIYMGIRAPRILPARTRLEVYDVWDIVSFLINAILFVLIGLQLRVIVGGLSGYQVSTLAWYALAVTGVVVGARLTWSFTIPYLIRAIDRRPAQRARRIGARWRLMNSWSGMRGAVSLAVALALPYAAHTGSFPKRNLIVFLTFTVIFLTLVGQGLSLPTLICRLGLNDGGASAEEETRARLIAAKAALTQIDALAGEDWTNEQTVEKIRTHYQQRKRLLAVRAGKVQDEGEEDLSSTYRQMMRLVLQAQRQALLRLRSNGRLSTEAMNRIIRELDLEESRLEP